MSRGRSETTTKVFVGSLPPGVTPEDLRKLFEPYGVIAECDIANRCGFLHLEDQDLANKAIVDLNGVDFMGGKISVEKGRVKRMKKSGPMRGGKDRGGPYSRGGDFRGPPRNGGYGGGGGRDYPPYRGGDRFGGGGYDRPPQRGGYGGGGYGGQDDRRGGMGGYEDRRGGGGFPNERFDDCYPDRRPYDDRPVPPAYPDAPRGGFDDRRGGPGGYDDRRPMLNDSRALVDQQGPPPPRGGPGSFDRPGGADLFSRRDQSIPKPVGGFNDRGVGGYGGGSNGYAAAPGYGAASSPGGGYGSGGYGSPAAPPAGAYGDRGGYAAAGTPYGSPGGYGDSYGSSGGGARGSYETAYPPLPPQRGFASGGGPGPRRDMAPGRRF